MVKKLVEFALDARNRACAEHSKFKVGASLVTKSGKIYTGCNIESSSYGLTICAERLAVFKAISEGNDAITEILVVADTKEPVSPCGACRQIIADFAPDATIHLCNLSGEIQTYTLNQLLPNRFKSEDFLNEK